MIDFKRTIFVKKLFNSEGVINNFNYIKFESLKAFVLSIKNDFFKTGYKHNIEINIKKYLEFKKLIQIMEKTDIAKTNYFRIILNTDLLKYIFPKKIKTSEKFEILYECEDVNFNINELMGMKKNCMWLQENPLSLKLKINYNNYVKMFNNIPAMYNQFRFRFFDLNFDYHSFKDMRIDEIKKLEFWINHFNNWRISSTDVNNRGDLEILMKSDTEIFKRIFVSEDMKLYLSEENMKDNKNDFLLDLLKHKKHDGEDINFKELNKFLQYKDLKQDNILFQFKPRSINGFLIDFYQNKKVNKNVCEIPLICNIIMDLLAIGVNENKMIKEEKIIMCKEMNVDGKRKCIEEVQ